MFERGFSRVNESVKTLMFYNAANAGSPKFSNLKTLFNHNNKFVDVLWFKYLLLRACTIVNLSNFHTFIVISPSKTADWQSKARNNKYLNQRTSTNLLL